MITVLTDPQKEIREDRANHHLTLNTPLVKVKLQQIHAFVSMYLSWELCVHFIIKLVKSLLEEKNKLLAPSKICICYF